MRKIPASIVASLCIAILVISCRRASEGSKDKANRAATEARAAQAESSRPRDAEESLSQVPTLPQSVPADGVEQQWDEDFRQMMHDVPIGDVDEIAFSGEDFKLPRGRSPVPRDVWRRMLALSIFSHYEGSIIEAFLLKHITGKDTMNKAIALTIYRIKTGWDTSVESVPGDPRGAEQRFRDLQVLATFKLEVIGRTRFPQIWNMTLAELDQRGWTKGLAPQKK